MCSNDEPTRHGPIDRVLRARSRATTDFAGRRAAGKLAIHSARSQPKSLPADRVAPGSVGDTATEEHCPEESR